MPKHSLAIADHAAKLTAAEARQYVHHNRMDCHVVTVSVVVSSHIDAGDHPVEAVQRSSLLQKVASASCHRVPYSQQDELAFAGRLTRRVLKAQRQRAHERLSRDGRKVRRAAPHRLETQEW